MKVSECMSNEVQVVTPDRSVRDVASIMAQTDAGIVPVQNNDRLVGMVTDRDIVVRGIASGKGPDAKVADVMTQDVKYCFDDDDVEQVARNMGEIQVRRLPVVNHDKRLVGIISLGDIAKSCGGAISGQALSGIARQGGQHTQARA